MADNPGYIPDKKGSRSDGQGINSGSSGSGTSIDSGNTSARDGSTQCIGSQKPFPGIPLQKNAESSFEMTIPPVEVPPDTTPDHSGGGQLLYTITDTPPWYLCVLLGLQHYLTMVGATITLPFILTPLFCMMDDNPARGEILSTIFFVCGIVTFLQVTFGVRLPIVQGGTFAFLVPTIAILSTSFPACDFAAIGNMTAADEREEWQMRIREVQGAIAVSSLFQILIGFTGLIGLVVTFITPLAIAPTISLVGLALFETASSKAATNWGIASLTIGLLILFSQYLESYSIPIPIYKRNSGCSFVKLRIFGLMPVLLSILLSWALCAILTAADALPEGSAARTDTAGQLIANSPWFRVPYPGQWGLPTVSVAGIFGMMAGVLASIVESVGDYYACARLSGAPPPPRHAINRGIGVEGIGCLIAGLWGTGNGTTSYSENIGAIGITKVRMQLSRQRHHPLQRGHRGHWHPQGTCKWLFQ